LLAKSQNFGKKIKDLENKKTVAKIGILVKNSNIPKRLFFGKK